MTSHTADTDMFCFEKIEIKKISCQSSHTKRVRTIGDAFLELLARYRHTEHTTQH